MRRSASAQHAATTSATTRVCDSLLIVSFAFHSFWNLLHNKIVAYAIVRARLRAVVIGFSAAKAAIKREELSMLSNGTAMFRTLRDTNRAALGCPSITG